MKAMSTQTGILITTLLLSLGLGATGQAASFDCSKAITETEKAICADPELGALDEALGLQWSRMSSIFPRSNQFDWIERRDNCDNNSCIKREIEERIDFLKEVNEIIGDHSLLTCGVGETILSVNTEKKDTFILMMTGNYFTRIPVGWNSSGSGVCRYFEYHGYDGSTEIKIEENGRCSSSELPFEEDLAAHLWIGSLYFKCSAIE